MRAPYGPCVLLAYVDESYSEGAIALACVVVSERRVTRLTQGLADLVAARARSVPHLDAGAELHAFDLAGARVQWAPLAGKVRLRAEVYRDALEVIAMHAVCVIAHCRIPGPARGGVSVRDAHADGLRQVVDRATSLARARGEELLVFVDEVSYRDHLRERVMRDAVPGLIDTLHFAHSSFSRPMQAADLCAYLIRRRALPAAVPARFRTIDPWLWEAIAPKVDLVQEGP